MSFTNVGMNPFVGINFAWDKLNKCCYNFPDHAYHAVAIYHLKKMLIIMEIKTTVGIQ